MVGYIKSVGDYLVIWSAVNHVKVYKRNIDNYIFVSEIPLPTRFGVGKVSFNPDGNILIIAEHSPDNQRLLFYKRDGDVFNIYDTKIIDCMGINNVTFSNDGQYLVVLMEHIDSIIIYKRNIDDFIALPSLMPNAYYNILSASFSPDDKYLALSCSGTPYLFIYKRSGDIFTQLNINLPAYTASNLHSCFFSPDGSRFISSNHQTMYFYKYDDNDSFVLEFQENNGYIIPMTFNKSDNYLFAGNLIGDTSVYLYIYKYTGIPSLDIHVITPTGLMQVEKIYVITFNETTQQKELKEVEKVATITDTGLKYS